MDQASSVQSSTTAHIQIDNEEINSSQRLELVVRQRLNDHWTCSMLLHALPDQRPKVEDLIGEDLKITVSDPSGQIFTIFSGTIAAVQLRHEITGNFSARIEAISYSKALDYSPDVAYFAKSTAKDVAQQVVEKTGLTLSDTMPDGPALSYMQWHESGFAFALRLIDDTECWLRPAVDDGVKGIEVQSKFSSGPTLVWRKGEYGLFDWSQSAMVAPTGRTGVHYDPLPMQSQISSKSDSVDRYGDPIGLASAAESAGEKLNALWASDVHRSVTLEDHSGYLQKESRRAKANLMRCEGRSRNMQVRAGDEVKITGLDGADGTYGVIECEHRWTPVGGYENNFVATTATKWTNPVRPARPLVSGISIARVIANYDPHNQGRVQVQYIWQEDSHTTWARVMTPHAGAGFGMLFTPEVGDEVVVKFLDGDPERPIVMGSLWNGVQQPPTDPLREGPDNNGPEFEKNDIKRIITKSGNRMTMADTAEKETVAFATPRSNKLLMTELADETGRPVVVLHTEGDMILSAPNGRIHMHSQLHSREVGKPVEVVTYSHQFEAHDRDTDEILSGRHYQIRLASGRVIRGITDSNGLTERVYTDSPEELTHFFLEEEN